MESVPATAHEIPYLREIVTFLMAAVVIVPVFHRMRASPVLGYLFVGAVIGPFGLQVVDDIEGVVALAELGVVFLLFAIGLELSWERLSAMRRLVFGLGGAQVLISTVAIGSIAHAWGNSVQVSIILGLALALSSTAVIIQLLIERGEFASPVGRTGFAVLLFQDLSVVPLLALADIFGRSGARSFPVEIALAMGKAAFALLLIMTLGRVLMRHAYPVIARTRSQELFIALTLLIILAAAWATGASGLSMALGAFLAGLLLSETEFRHQIETSIQPFRGLLLGLFFISIGMSIDFTVLVDGWRLILLSVAGLILIKAGILTALCRAFGLPAATALRVGLLLGAGGEFAFIAISISLGNGLLSPAVGQFMFLVAALSLAATPLLATAGAWLGRLLEHRHGQAQLGLETGTATPAALEDHVIIAGYGRVGRIIAGLLQEQGVSFIGLDMDVSRTAAARTAGAPVYYGDASHPDVLERVGAERAAMILVTVDNHDTSVRILTEVQRKWPKMPVYIRAHDLPHAEDLLRMGATYVAPETFDASLRLAKEVLRDLGTPLEAINAALDDARQSSFGSAEDSAVA